jgi:large subunit ribosomal protein L5
MIPRLKTQYNNTVVQNLQKKFSLKNKYMVPKFSKVILNMGLGSDATDKKKVQNCVDDMSLISGQRPIVTKFKKSISNFKTRKGSTAGVKVTLRSNKMYEFLDRLVNIALPRIKDFRGLNINSFDNFGNYSFGIKEHIIFPEINFDKVDRIRGMDITLVTSSDNKNINLELLKEMNFPFFNKNKETINPKIESKKN